MTSVQIVELIEKRLKQMGIKKGVFYEKTGISSATLSQWRTGKYFPSYEAIQKINAYLGLNLALSEEPVTEDRLSREEEEIVWMYRRADKKTQAIIQTVLRAEQQSGE